MSKQDYQIMLGQGTQGRLGLSIKTLQRHFACFGSSGSGKGGKGNKRYANSVRQAPRIAQPGESGEAVRPSEAQPGLGAGRLAALWRDGRSVRIGVWVKSPIIGTLVGALPGAGAAMAAFLSYSEAKRSSAEPERFGSGVPEGIVAPEAANNAASTGAMLPMLTLGIPGSPTTALLLGGMMIWGLQPGPMMFVNDKDFVWGLIASLYVANLFALLLNLSAIPVFIWVLKLPFTILATIIYLLCMIGTYAVTESYVEDLRRAAAFAIPGDITTLTGGYIYERRLLEGLRALGHDVAHLALDGSFPDPGVPEDPP